MRHALRPVAWRSPPLAFQIMALLLGGLIVAQLVTLLLTLVLPPEPPVKYGLDDIAAMFRSDARARNGLERRTRDAAPVIGGRGWLLSATSRDELAGLLDVAPERVMLAFYTPLPFAGTFGASGEPVAGADVRGLAPLRFAGGDGALLHPAVLLLSGGGASPAALLRLVQARSGPGLPGREPGGGFPGRGFPRDGVPSDRFPRGDVPADRAGRDGPPGGSAPRAGLPDRSGGSPSRPARSPSNGTVPSPGGTRPPLYGPPAPGASLPPLTPSPTIAPPPADADADAEGASVDADPLPVPDRPERDAANAREAPPAGPERAPAVVPPAVSPPSPPAAAPAVEDRSRATPASPPPAAALSETAIERVGLQGAIDRARRLFGLAPAPSVAGDFIAALRLADGRWLVVQPRANAWLSAWQVRVALWFLIAFGITAPLGWLFARRLSRPLDRFAAAAARLGRDPSVALAALDGPAEIGRAAHAFNLMQQRLRSFVDDRTAMVGAISHDLRTPLTRLRFRIEDVPDEVRAGMLQEVDEMEAMIASVLAFLRDAATAGVRERLDLRDLLEDVVEDAAVIGAAVPVEAESAATVEVEVMGMRRVLANLVENALKYGAHARIRLTVSQDEAIAAVIDDGPGLPEEELEQVFQPFYRTAAAKASGAPGTGLGLAVCRSIARAHGGDVRLSRTIEGFRAEVRVPLAYGAAARALAA